MHGTASHITEFVWISQKYTFQVQILRSLLVYAISEVNASTPLLAHLDIECKLSSISEVKRITSFHDQHFEPSHDNRANVSAKQLLCHARINTELKCNITIIQQRYEF